MVFTNERPKEVPAWGLLFQSPYSVEEDSNSWIGGHPYVPNSFKWPTDNNENPRYFLAQIDLDSLDSSCPSDLPSTGTMLIFFSGGIQDDRFCYDYSCHIFSSSEMSNAVELKCPDNLKPLEELGFFHNSPVFNKWPITLFPFVSKGEEHPPVFSKIAESPANWIKNWAIAVLDADLVIESLTREIEPSGEGLEDHQRRWVKILKDNPNDYVTERNLKVIKSKIDHYELMKERAPDLLKTLSEWKNYALSKNQSDQVDYNKLEEIFELRNSLKNEMQDYSPKYILGGNPKEVWNRLRNKFSKSFYRGLPEEYRPFVELIITSWRGHRFFGLEPEFPNNAEYLRGYDCLISVAADELLGTESEHEYGMSVWCLSDEMAKGKFDNGQFIRHCAV